jgi:adenylate cyclase
MAEPCKLTLLDQDTTVFEAPLSGPLELGRQRAGEPEPVALLPATDTGPSRLVIAPQQARDNVSRRHLSLLPLPSGAIRVSNHSQAPVARGDGEPPLAAGAGEDLLPPFTLALPSGSVRVELAATVDEHGVSRHDQHTTGPAAAGELSLDRCSLELLQPAQVRLLLEGTTRVLGVLQNAVGTEAFLARAAQALVRIVGLDTGRVLLRQADGWSVKAGHGAGAEGPAWRPSRHVLDRLLQPPPALVWQEPRRAQQPSSASLRLLDAVVAAPLLDRDDQVIGALYGERLQASPQAGCGDGQVERLLVNLLASGVATGLARLEQEQAVLRANALFEQFFTHDLAQRLATDPGLMEPRQAEVTVLFADVRGFSKHSEKLSPTDTFAWLHEVLNALSHGVSAEGGVLVDYVGDELFALWGAPEPQADQAARAVRAALAMQAALPGLSQKWQALLGEPIHLGVGLNSGRALVGNTGSQYKFKYGPRGHTVNVGSRVQGLTKYLRCGVLATAATRWLLEDGFIARRVVKARVAGIEEAVDVYEVERAGAPQRRAFFADSEAALDALEAGDWTAAARLAGQQLSQHSNDGPLLLILARAAEALVKGGAGFDPVWTPPGK